MYAILRRYNTDSVAEVARRIKNEFVPVISKASGFLAYYVIDEGAGAQTSISIFEDETSAALSNKLAADWVREHPTLLPDPPEISAGEVVVHQRPRRARA